MFIPSEQYDYHKLAKYSQIYKSQNYNRQVIRGMQKMHGIIMGVFPI